MLCVSNCIYCIMGRTFCVVMQASHHLLSHTVACKGSSFLCKNGRCISFMFTCNNVNNCGDNSDENSCPTVPDIIDNSSTFIGKSIGGFIGGVAGILFLIITLIVVTLVITLGICVCNKNCPIYKWRHKQRPRVNVGVITIGEPNQENMQDNVPLIKNDEFDEDSNIEKGKLIL